MEKKHFSLQGCWFTVDSCNLDYSESSHLHPLDNLPSPPFFSCRDLNCAFLSEPSHSCQCEHCCLVNNIFLYHFRNSELFINCLHVMLIITKVCSKTGFNPPIPLHIFAS